jgi:hypothetical protein
MLEPIGKHAQTAPIGRFGLNASGPGFQQIAALVEPGRFGWNFTVGNGQGGCSGHLSSQAKKWIGISLIIHQQTVKLRS